MSVEFYKDKGGKEYRWHILEDGEDAPIHACHEGFSSRHRALQNLFINHSMMSLFVNCIARGDITLGQNLSNIRFDEGGDGIRWKIQSDNHEIVGMAHRGYKTIYDAVDNLIITYTMLTMYVAQAAQARTNGDD